MNLSSNKSAKISLGEIIMKKLIKVALVAVTLVAVGFISSKGPTSIT